jgi:hypothetical protein
MPLLTGRTTGHLYRIEHAGLAKTQDVPMRSLNTGLDEERLNVADR